MSYTEETLSAGEEVFYQGEVSRFYLVALAVFSLANVVAGLVFLISSGGFFNLAIGLISLAYLYSWKKGTEFVITNKRVITKSGLISRSVVELNLERVETIQVEQSITGRLLRYGDVVFSGSGNPMAKMKAVENPMKFRQKCLEAKEKFRKI